MKVADLFAIAIVCAWSVVAPAARADCVSCGLGSSDARAVCEAMCPLVLVGGDCSSADAGATRCNSDYDSACVPIPDQCKAQAPDGAMLPTRGNDGAPILYCMVPRDCDEDVAGTGCVVGKDDAPGGHLSRFPILLIVGGAALLIVDRRRRKRSER